MSQSSPQVSIAEVQQAHQNLLEAERCKSSGDLESAGQICEKLIERYPEYVGAHVLLAETYLQKFNHVAAFPHLIRAAILNPNDPTILINLGKMYLELDAKECAIEILERAIERHPDNPGPYYVMGEVWFTIGDHRRAVQFFEKSLSLNPGDPDMTAATRANSIHLGRALAYMGAFDDAIVTLTNALELPLSRPQKCHLYYALSELPYLAGNFDLLEALNELGDTDPSDSDSTAFKLAYARGFTLNKLGRHKEAWKCWADSNRQIADNITDQRRSYLVQNEVLLEMAANWKEPKAGKYASTGSDAPISLFIIGPSRSGKSSLERLLAPMDGIVAGYEHAIVTNTARYISQRASLLTANLLVNLPGELDDTFRELYHSKLSEAAGDAQIFTITHPAAIYDVGRLTECVPNARFVFMKRDHDDVALRIFTKFYASNTNQYGYDLADIYEYISQYQQMIDIWLKKIGNKAIAMQYEDMVDDPAGAIKRVAELCGTTAPPKPAIQIFDDRGCSAPYRDFLHAAKA